MGHWCRKTSFCDENNRKDFPLWKMYLAQAVPQELRQLERKGSYCPKMQKNLLRWEHDDTFCFYLNQNHGATRQGIILGVILKLYSFDDWELVVLSQLVSKTGCFASIHFHLQRLTFLALLMLYNAEAPFWAWFCVGQPLKFWTFIQIYMWYKL